MTPESRGWPKAITTRLTYPKNQMANLGHPAVLDCVFDRVMSTTSYAASGFTAVARGSKPCRARCSDHQALKAGEPGAFLVAPFRAFSWPTPSLHCNSPTCSQAATKFQLPFFSLNSFNPFNLFNPFGCGFAALCFFAFSAPLRLSLLSLCSRSLRVHLRHLLGHVGFVFVVFLVVGFELVKHVIGILVFPILARILVRERGGLALLVLPVGRIG